MSGGPRRPLVKVCGLTTISALRVAEGAGASHVGMVVEVARSPRSLTREQAGFLARASRVPAVLVTTATEVGHIAELVAAVRPDAVQVHGGVGPGLVAELREVAGPLEVWHVIAVEAEGSADPGRYVAEAIAAAEAGASKVVIDSASGGRSGGTGLAANWEVAAAIVEASGATPVILAGGLTAGNVARAVAHVRPAGVDVSSGVESAPGVKSPRLIAEFVRNVFAVTDRG